MKNLIIIIGTILLGAYIVNSLVLGGGENSLKSAAIKVIGDGSSKITQEGEYFSQFQITEGVTG